MSFENIMKKEPSEVTVDELKLFIENIFNMERFVEKVMLDYNASELKNLNDWYFNHDFHIENKEINMFRISRIVRKQCRD